MSTPSLRLIVLGLVTIYLVWGSTYLAIRLVVETLPPFLMAGARFILAGLLMSLVLLVCGRFRATPVQWLWNSAVGFFMLLGGNGLVCWAEQTVPSGLATLIVSCNPLMMVLAEWLIFNHSRGSKGAKPSWLVFSGLLIGILGLGLLVAPSLQADIGGEFDPWRIGAIITACFTWTIGSMMSRYGKNPVDPFTGSAIQMICGGVWLTLFGLLVGEWSSFDWESVTWVSVTAWWYLVIAGSLIAFTTFVWLMKHTSPTLISTYAYVNPVVAVLLGWAILDEKLDGRTMISAMIIISGVAMMSYGRGQQALKASKQ